MNATLRERLHDLDALIGTTTDKAQADEWRAERSKIQAKLGKRSRETDDVDTRGMGAPDEYRGAFDRYLMSGAISPELRSAPQGVGSGGIGGYLVPQGFWDNLQVAMKAYGGTAADFKQVVTDTGNLMPWPTNDPTAVVGSLLSENTQVSEVDYTFGQGQLSAYTYTGGVQLASVQLVNDSAFDVGQFIATRIGEQLGRAIAAAAISGTGSSQPLGITTAINAAGSRTGTGPGFLTLGTAQKVRVLSDTPGTAGEDTAKTELQLNALAPSTVTAMIKAIDPAYRRQGAKFYMNDNQLAGMRRVVDAYGRVFWPSLWDDQNTTLAGWPVVVDPNLSDLTASTCSGPVFGHLPSAMVQRSVKGVTVMRLEERYADYLQIGWIGYLRIDIRSNDLRAAVQFKCAAT